MKDRLDKLLAFLESQDGVVSNGTMLTLGSSVLFSRMSVRDTRLISQYSQARPLGTNTLKYTPVHSNGAWVGLYVVRMQSYVLSILTAIDKSYAVLESKIDVFRTALLQSHLDLPTEEPPILLRNFAKRETLAMFYHNIKSGYCVFPQLRPGPDTQQQEIMKAFWWFFGEATYAVTRSYFLMKAEQI